MNRVAIARRLAYASLALSPVPIVCLVAYARLAPEPHDVIVQYVLSTAMLTSLLAAPLAAALSTWLSRGTPLRRLGVAALGLWLLVFGFLIYTSVR